ncbi:hypothetical protein P4B35_02945 [Pontiellaceae bacterium B12227]|nr:hypothetical protein [Pontiellaceae bacterium B12227]
MFKMRPNMGTLTMAIVVLLLGALFLYDGHRDPGDIPAHNRSNLIFAISVVISGLLFILSTGRMWFKHLWHDRYAGKKRGSRR